MRGQSTNETYAQQIVAERSGCFICGKRPTFYMVKDKGYCEAHKVYAADARKSLAGIVDSYHAIGAGEWASRRAKKKAPMQPRMKGLRRGSR